MNNNFNNNFTNNFTNNIDNNFDNNLDNNLSELDIIVNIRVVQRNSRKSLTLVEGLEQLIDFDFKKVNKYLKKKLCCNSTIKINKKTNEKFIQLQGNHSENIKDYLINIHNLKKDNIILHG